MSRTKLIEAVSLAMVLITMITSDQLPIYASPTTEDDGYTYPDDATEEEKEEIDEREQEAWEDAGRPGDTDNDDNDSGDDGEQIFTCSDGSTVTGDEECPSTGPNPYCDKVGPNYRGSCHDRKDYSESTGLYPCNDGTQKTDWRDCKDATDSNNDDNNNKRIITSSGVQAPTPAPITAENSYCYDAGSEENGDPFVSVLYQNCLKANWGEVYYQGMIDGCMERGGNVGGNSKEDCERWYGLSIAPHPVDRGGDKPTEDIACLYDTSLPQCTPVDGKCRDGYNMNEDGRCFPEHSRCPNGYHGHEDDESGECISNNTPCSQGYVMTVMDNGGFNCEQKRQKAIVINSSNTTTTGTITPLPDSTTESSAADASNCKLDGSVDGIQQIFDTAKYQACKLHTHNDKIYYDGFVTGCMNVGNTKLICEAVANSNILNINTQNPQTPAATTIPQSSQAIQPAAIN